MWRWSGGTILVTVVVVLLQCIARPGHTHHGSIWGCGNYGLLAADERTDGRDRSHVTPLTLHICCLPVSLSFHIGDDPPAGDVSLQPARPLSLELTYVYEGSTEERLLWEPSCPAFVRRRRHPRPPILEAADLRVWSRGSRRTPFTCRRVRHEVVAGTVTETEAVEMAVPKCRRK